MYPQEPLVLVSIFYLEYHSLYYLVSPPYRSPPESTKTKGLVNTEHSVTLVVTWRHSRVRLVDTLLPWHLRIRTLPSCFLQLRLIGKVEGRSTHCLAMADSQSNTGVACGDWVMTVWPTAKGSAAAPAFGSLNCLYIVSPDS